MTIFLDIDNLKNHPFPEEFVIFAKAEPKVDIEPWWLLVYEEGKVNSWHKTLKELYPKRTLVPFAKFSANDDIACFDGDDTSGDAKVVIIHAYASDGWELHGSYENFNAWLDAAIDTHNSWEEDE